MNLWWSLIQDNLFIAGGDHTYWLAQGNFWWNKIFAWQSFEGPGESNNSIPQFAFFWLFKAGELLNISRSNLQIIILSLLFTLAGLAFYLFYKELKRLFSFNITYKIDGILAAIFYVIHPFDINIIQIEKNLILLALPLSLYFLIKSLRLNDYKYSVIAAFFSIIFSGMAINLAVFVSLYVFVFISVAIAGALVKKLKFAFISFGLYSVLSFLFNLWWVIPTLLALKLDSESSVKFLQQTNFLNSVGLIDLIRLISTWAWRSSHNGQAYFPYANEYDTGFMYLLSYFFILIPLVFGIVKAYKAQNKKIYLYCLSAIVTILFLAKGSTPPFGDLYKLLFTYFPMFSIFREPSAKFILGYKIHIAILLGLFINYVLISKPRFRYSISLFFFFAILFISRPTLTGEIVNTNWNGVMRSWAIQIPNYWYEYSAYVNQINNNQSSLITYPPTGYGAPYNWEHGFNGTDIAKYFTDRRVLSYYSFTIDNKSRAVNMLYPKNIDKTLPQNIWGIFNIEYLLHEKDVDWRYSSLPNYSPSQTSKFLSNLPFTLEKSFGYFDLNYVERRIPNGDTNYFIRYKLYNELPNQTILDLYKINPNQFVDKVFIPEFTVRSEDSNLVPAAFLKEDINKFGLIPIDLKNDYKDADLLFVSGSPLLNATRKELNWDSGWVWPSVSTNPQSLKYKLVEFKEKYSLTQVKNELELAELQLWYASKRLAEIKTFNLPDNLQTELIDSYLDTMKTIAVTLTEVDLDERNNSFYETTNKLFSYNNAANTYLGFDLKDKATQTKYKEYKDVWSHFEEEVDISCLGLCFRFDIPEDGIYKVYTYTEELRDLSAEYKNVSIYLDDKDLSKNIQDLSEEKALTELGSFNLNKGTEYIETSISTTEGNIVDPDAWTDINNTDQWNPTGDINFYIHSFPIAVINDLAENKNNSLVEFSVREQYIPEWKNNSEYELSFDYEIDNSVFGVYIAENNSGTDFNTLEEKKNILSDAKSEIFSRYFGASGSSQPECDYTETSCKSHFKTVIDSGRLAQGADVYIYSYAKGNTGSVKISNFSIKKKRNLSLFLAKDLKAMDQVQTSSEELTPPQVSFDKINPTKYEVKVSNVTKSHILVLSETFNPGWKAYIKEGDKLVSIVDKNHIQANAYANSWFIDKEALSIDDSYELVIEYYPQKYIYIGAIIAAVTLISSLLFITFGDWFKIKLNFKNLDIPMKNLSSERYKKYKKLSLRFIDKYWVILAVSLIIVAIVYNSRSVFSVYIEVNFYLMAAFLALIFRVFKTSIRTIISLAIFSLVANFIFLYFSYTTAAYLFIILFYILLLFIVVRLLLRNLKSYKR